MRGDGAPLFVDPLYVLNGANLAVAGNNLGTGGVVGYPLVNSRTGRVYVRQSTGITVFGPSPTFTHLGQLAGAIQAVNPSANRLYVQSGPDLQALDGNGHSLVATIPGAGGPAGVNTSRNRLYVVDQTHGVVKVIDGATNIVVGAVSLGPGVTPAGASPAVDSSKHRVYVAGSDGRLYVIADPPAPPALASSTFFGGSGDQRGTAITAGGGGLYVVGNVQPQNQNPGDSALVLKYALPPDPSPVWSRTFHSGSVLFGAAATSEGLYGVGWSYDLSDDGVGGKEVKSLLAKFALDGSSGPGPHGATLYNAPNFFSYRGVESLSGAISVMEGGSPFVYAAGGGQPCSYGAYFVAKFDTLGIRVAAATDSAAGITFNGCPFPVTGGSSAGGLTALNGDVYVAGSSSWLHEEDTNGRPTLWKYDSSLNLVWRQKDTTQVGALRAVTGLGGSLYGVGYSVTPGTPNSEDYLVQKYDEAGNLVWSRGSGGAGTDILNGVVAIGGRLFAVGYTRSSGAGGADAVVLEIDPATGSTLSTTLFGGALDDIANGVATDGTELHVVGESRSFASAAGNAVGQNDIMVLRYALGPPAENHPPSASAQTVTTAEDTPVAITLTGSDPDGDTLAVAIVRRPAHGLLTGAGADRTYTPRRSFNGTDHFTFTVSDGHLASTPTTVVIRVTPVNDPPFFHPIADRTVRANTRRGTVWITGVSPGPRDEQRQTVVVSATSSEPALIPPPTISGTGAARRLVYRPVPGMTGTAVITVTADDGQPAHHTFTRTFMITVTPVADVTAPVFSGLSSAAALSPSQIALTWAPASDDTANPGQIVYEICRSHVPGQCAVSFTATKTAQGVTSRTIGGLTPGRTYFFVVRARDLAGNREANTVERSATTPR